MNFIEFLRHGVPNNHFYNRFNSCFPKDQAVAKFATYQYSGEVSNPQVKDFTLRRLLDNAVEIITVDDTTRRDAQEFWSKRQAECLKFGVVGILMTTAAAIGGIAVGMLLANPLTIVPFAVVGVTGIALATLGFYRKSQADNQLEAWKDPLLYYQDLRRKAGTEGFKYVYSNRLINTVIHKEEGRALWQSWADQMFKQYQHSIHDSNDIKKFFTINPLDPKIINYAFSDLAPSQSIQDLSIIYDDLQKNFNHLRAEAQSRRDKIERKKSDRIAVNEAQRNALLAPARFVKETVKEESRREMHNKFRFIKSKNPHNPHMRKAREEYNSKCLRDEIMYDVATMPINLTFNNNLYNIKHEADEQINQVMYAENVEIQKFAPDVSGISKSYLSLRTDPSAPPFNW